MTPIESVVFAHAALALAQHRLAEMERADVGEKLRRVVTPRLRDAVNYWKDALARRLEACAGGQPYINPPKPT